MNSPPPGILCSASCGGFLSTCTQAVRADVFQEDQWNENRWCKNPNRVSASATILLASVNFCMCLWFMQIVPLLALVLEFILQGRRKRLLRVMRPQIYLERRQLRWVEALDASWTWNQPQINGEKARSRYNKSRCTAGLRAKAGTLKSIIWRYLAVRIKHYNTIAMDAFALCDTFCV